MPRFDIDKPCGIIYKVTNLLNNKMYIGQTINLNKRILDHIGSARRKSNSYFHKALRKYGKENFEWSIICECYSKEELNRKETQYITKIKTLAPNGYNLTLGGEGTVGYKFSDIQLENLRKSHIGHTQSTETKEKKRLSMKGKNKRIGCENNRYGIHLSDETKQKISIKNKRYSENIINKIIELRNNKTKWKDIVILLNIPMRTAQYLYKDTKI